MDQFVDMASIRTHFETLEDPRHTRNRKHLLVEVIVICVADILCGCDGPTAIHRWATERQEWLRQYLALANGIPSRDGLRRIPIALRPEAFQECFRAWIAAAIPPAGPDAPPPPRKRLVAIDGKSCRGSHDAGKGLGALHIVSAWASEEGIALGQVATEDRQINTRWPWLEAEALAHLAHPPLPDLGKRFRAEHREDPADGIVRWNAVVQLQERP